MNHIPTVVGVIVTISFYGIYIIKNMSLRTKGIKANQMGVGKKPKKTLFIETFLALMTFSIGFIHCGIVLAILLSFKPIYSLIYVFPVYVCYVGSILGILSIITFLVSVIQMSDSWRAGIPESDKTSLVTSGIYKYSRNPAFLSFDLFYIGFALIFPNIVIGIMTLIAIILFHYQIKEEEKYLKRTFGDDYINYCKKAPRYLMFF